MLGGCTCLLSHSVTALQGLHKHEGDCVLLGDATGLAGSLADGLVHPPVPELAVLGAVPRHLTSAHLQTTDIPSLISKGVHLVTQNCPCKHTGRVHCKDWHLTRFCSLTKVYALRLSFLTIHHMHTHQFRDGETCP